jgi:hypothetical protein
MAMMAVVSSPMVTALVVLGFLPVSGNAGMRLLTGLELFSSTG